MMNNGNGGLYFAYGSNMNLDQMRYRCPDAEPLMPVVLRNYELSFRGGGVATILPKPGATVHGLLWDLTPACERALDIYEGFPRLYGKQSVVVRDEKNNQSFRVMAYVMTPEHARTPREPPHSYFNGILQGYRQNGLPIQPLYNALRATREEIVELEAQARADSWKERFNWRYPNNKGKPKGRGR